MCAAHYIASISLKLSFRSPAEKKQTGTNKQTLFGNFLNAINRPGFCAFLINNSVVE